MLKKGVTKEQIVVFDNSGRRSCENQYFDNTILNLEQEEVFVDGGCLNLQTSVEFEKFCKENGKILKRTYAFEPDKYNFDICNNNKGDLRDVVLIQAGLWSTNTDLHFTTVENGAFSYYE